MNINKEAFLLTRESQKMIKEQLAELVKKRDALIQEISDTPRNDTSESSDRDSLIFNKDSIILKIETLAKTLENSKTFVKDEKSSLVQIGSLVSYLETKGETSIVKEVEISDPFQNNHSLKKLSYLSPLGRALFSKAVGDEEIVVISPVDSSKNYKIRIEKIT